MRSIPIANSHTSGEGLRGCRFGDSPLVTVVDDDRAVAASLCAVIRSIGLDAQVCSSSQELLRNAECSRPGCIILDLGLSNDPTSGLDLLAGIANDTSFPPVIIFTGDPDIRTVVQSFRRGAVDFLLKPSSVDEISTAIRRAIEHDIARRGSQHFAKSA